MADQADPPVEALSPVQPFILVVCKLWKIKENKEQIIDLLKKGGATIVFANEKCEKTLTHVIVPSNLGKMKARSIRSIWYNKTELVSVDWVYDCMQKEMLLNISNYFPNFQCGDTNNTTNQVPIENVNHIANMIDFLFTNSDTCQRKLNKTPAEYLTALIQNTEEVYQKLQSDIEKLKMDEIEKDAEKDLNDSLTTLEVAPSPIDLLHQLADMATDGYVHTENKPTTTSDNDTDTVAPLLTISPTLPMPSSKSSQKPLVHHKKRKNHFKGRNPESSKKTKKNDDPGSIEKALDSDKEATSQSSTTQPTSSQTTPKKKSTNYSDIHEKLQGFKIFLVDQKDIDCAQSNLDVIRNEPMETFTIENIEEKLCKVRMIVKNKRQRKLEIAYITGRIAYIAQQLWNKEKDPLRGNEGEDFKQYIARNLGLKSTKAYYWIKLFCLFTQYPRFIKLNVGVSNFYGTEADKIREFLEQDKHESEYWAEGRNENFTMVQWTNDQ
jgi:hypothetical protein